MGTSANMKFLLTVIGHFVSTVILLKVISYAIPTVVLGYYAFACNAVFCVAVAYITFSLTRRKLLSAKVRSSDKAVFITGCDSGFGHLLAKRLDSKGFHVFAGCLFPSGTGANDLRKNCSNKLHIVEIDVRKDESAKRAAEYTKENLGPTKLWAIVNNAGIQKGFTVELTPIEWFQEVLDVNTLGQIRVCKAFLPLIRKAKGRIVNITSYAARFPHPHLTPYSVSKFASQALSECLRSELISFGVDVITIEPQAFESSITDPDRIRKAYEVMLETVEDDVLSSYKGKYLEKFKALQELFITSTSPKTHLVIDDIESAVSSVYPSLSYQTRSNLFLRLSLHIPVLAPPYLHNLLYPIVETCAAAFFSLNATKDSEHSKLK